MQFVSQLPSSGPPDGVALKMVKIHDINSPGRCIHIIDIVYSCSVLHLLRSYGKEVFIFPGVWLSTRRRFLFGSENCQIEL